MIYAIYENLFSTKYKAYLKAVLTRVKKIFILNKII